MSTNPNLQDAARKSRYGHREWLFWLERDGTPRMAPKSRGTLKQAMLASGTQRHFYLLIGGTSHWVRWPMAVIMWRNARFGY